MPWVLNQWKVSPALGNTRTSPNLLCYFSNGKTGRPNGGSGSWSEPKEGWKIFHIESKSFEIVLGGEATWLRSTPIRFSHYTLKTEIPWKLYGIRQGLPDPKIHLQPTLICSGVLRWDQLWFGDRTRSSIFRMGVERFQPGDIWYSGG